jgi:hypothetical protein
LRPHATETMNLTTAITATPCRKQVLASPDIVMISETMA